MSLLTKEQLLSRRERRFKTVTVQQLGEVRLRNVTERERARLESREANAKTDRESRQAALERRAEWIVFCCVDAAGVPLFGREDAADVAQLDAAVTVPLWTAITEHCVVYCSTEDTEKNSAAIDADDSPSA